MQETLRGCQQKDSGSWTDDDGLSQGDRGGGDEKSLYSGLLQKVECQLYLLTD